MSTRKRFALPSAVLLLTLLLGACGNTTTTSSNGATSAPAAATGAAAPATNAPATMSAATVMPAMTMSAATAMSTETMSAATAAPVQTMSAATAMSTDTMSAATAAPAMTMSAATATSSGATTAPAGNAGGSTGANPPTTVDQVDAIDPTGKKIEVVYWHNRPQADQDLLQSMFDQFNKSNPYGITARAEIAGASYNDVYNKVTSAIQAGQPPSMSVAYQNQAAFYRGQGAVIDLTPFLTSKKYGLSAADQADYFQTFLDSDANPQYKGERLGFPTQRSMAVLYYNADALQQLGQSGPPTDWKTFEDVACKYSDPAKKHYGLAVQHDISNFAAMVFSNGGRMLNEDGSAYVFNSQAGVDALALLQRLFKNKCAVEVPASERNGEQSRFANGNALFTLGSSSGLPFYADAVNKGGKFKW
nr:hypothetical protein [Herpetosiphonaceae bacterium]